MPPAKPLKKSLTATKQLRISFDRHSTLRQNLHDGIFSLLLEINPPPADQPFKLAMTPAIDLAKYVRTEKRLVSLAIAPPIGHGPPHSILDVAPELTKACKKETIVYLEGAGLTEHGAREILAGLTSLGINSIGALTGPALPDHPRDKNGRPLSHPQGYLDSVRLLRLIRDAEPEAFAGAGVNPFKYHIADSHLQYYKMLKKLNTGANFMVTQAGWDMKKYQELQWYLRSRELDEPFIARLLLLRPDDVTRILDHNMGGLVISREFAALLQRESALNETQALTAQVRRLALQAAGCRLFGYSGIQIAGLPDARIAAAVLDHVVDALETLDSYEDWQKAWTDFHSHVELAPYPHRYYVFKKLLAADAPDYLGDETPHTPETIPEPPASARLAWTWAHRLNLGQADNAFANLAKVALCGSRGPHPWRLDKTMLLSAAACPKGLEDGPCEGSRPDGLCEFGHAPCFYHKVLQLAQWRNEIEQFEAPLPSTVHPPDESTTAQRPSVSQSKPTPTKVSTKTPTTSSDTKPTPGTD